MGNEEVEEGKRRGRMGIGRKGTKGEAEIWRKERGKVEGKGEKGNGKWE